MITRGEDYAFARPPLTAKKLRAELGKNTRLEKKRERRCDELKAATQ